MASRLPIARLPAIGICLVLAAWSVRDAALSFWNAHDLGMAAGLADQDGAVQLQRAEQHLADPGYVWRHAGVLAGHARQALRDNPFDARALRQLALTGAFTDPERVNALAALSERVSRRDLSSQLWLIETAVASGDVAGALTHYDRALSVHREADSLLFPVLTGALDEGAVRAALSRYADRPWFSAFIGFAVANSTAPGTVASLLRQTRGHMDAAEFERQASSLLQQFIAQGDYAGARAFVLALAGADSGWLYDWRFAGAAIDPRYAPLSWRLTENEAMTADIDGTGRMQLTVASGSTGLVAERLSYLQPGDYALTQSIVYDAGAARAQLHWEAACANGEGELPFWRQDIPQRDGRITYRSLIRIPEGCAVQRWRLRITAADAQSASGVGVELLSLAAAKRE